MNDRKTADEQIKYRKAGRAWVFRRLSPIVQKRPVCFPAFDLVNDPLSPNDFWFPKAASEWSENQLETYIERLCIWSNGGEITDQMYADAIGAVMELNS